MNDESMFALLDPQFWVPSSRRAPRPNSAQLAGRILPETGWTSVSQGVWTYYEPQGWSGVKQGWKLHVSATPANAQTVLERVATVARDHPVAFKFASGPAVLALMLSKNWPREGAASSSPFIRPTRPRSSGWRPPGQATEGLDGPYILSDRRVPGSRIVFYRYGEHRAEERVDAEGGVCGSWTAPAAKPRGTSGAGGSPFLPGWKIPTGRPRCGW